MVGQEAPQPGPAVLSYFGGGARTTFHDIVELTDGTLLIAGEADHLDWLPAEVTRRELSVTGLPPASGTKVSFLLHTTGNLQQPLDVAYLPVGALQFFRWIRSTNLPGEPTGTLYVSGRSGEGYVIGRLDGNFVDQPATGFDWLFRVQAGSNEHVIAQPWDVDATGRVVFVEGSESGAMVGFLNAAGAREVRPRLRGSHWVGSDHVRGIGEEVVGAEWSRIRLPTDMRSDFVLDNHETPSMRMAIDGADENNDGVPDYREIHPDGNGNLRQGRWPIDNMIPTRIMSSRADGSVVRAYGYNGYRAEGRHWIGALTVDRRSGDFYIGFNIKSILPDPGSNKEQPDFEPAVISYAASGEMKWWSRLYTEWKDTNGNGVPDPGETFTSTPDQYLDGLAIDYSDAIQTGGTLVVVARCHGNSTSNFWSGDNVVARPGASGFQNRFTGTEGNIHLSWIGKFHLEEGTYLAGTFLGGFFRMTIGGKGNFPTVPYPEPIHDGWPSHNAGWPDLTTTRITEGAVRTDASGRVTMVVVGPRNVTTSNAHQKLPKRLGNSYDEGNSPWNYIVRTYEPNLKTLAYSSTITGVFEPRFGNEPSNGPVGADNTNLRGVFPLSHGVLVVGMNKFNSGTGLANGNPIPVANVPAWGEVAPPTTSPGLTAIAGVLPYSPDRVLPDASVDATTGVSPLAVRFSAGTPEDGATYAWEVNGAPARPGADGLQTFLEAGRQSLTLIATRNGVVSRSHFFIDVAAGAPLPTVTEAVDGLHLRVRTSVGRTYQLERADSLGGAWTPVGSPVAGTGDDLDAPLPIPTGDAGFYRLRVD